VPPVLRFIQHHASLDDRQAYSTFNMGAGFALFVAADEAAPAVQVAQQLGIGALVAGAVHDGPKQLTIEPLSLRFDADDLQLR
jgi:phosphoribosylformylglycinamidine cyclo-ligase